MTRTSERTLNSRLAQITGVLLCYTWHLTFKTEDDFQSTTQPITNLYTLPFDTFGAHPCGFGQIAEYVGIPPKPDLKRPL